MRGRSGRSLLETEWRVDTRRYRPSLITHGALTETLPAHEPVLPEPLFELLHPRPGEVILDLTVGLGGHAALLLAAVGPDGFLCGIDVDAGNLEIARRRLGSVGTNFQQIRGNFRNAAAALLHEMPHRQADCVLADLGPSSNQLDTPRRGFSFQEDGPLDMRMDDSLRTTAADLVNRLSERELSDVLFFNAQERFSRRIAKEICRARHDRRITRTSELVRVVCVALKVDPQAHRGKIHPATRTFMALRMAVNDELEAIRELLADAPSLLRPGGRFAVISFHSLEDGLAKRDFRERDRAGLYRILTKKPVVADPEERRRNPRSRSAKMRVVERTDRPIVGE